MDLAVDREHQTDGVFRNRIRRIGWHAHQHQPEPVRGGDVDIVEAGRAQGDPAHAALRQRNQCGLVQA